MGGKRYAPPGPAGVRTWNRIGYRGRGAPKHLARLLARITANDEAIDRVWSLVQSDLCGAPRVFQHVRSVVTLALAGIGVGDVEFAFQRLRKERPHKWSAIASGKFALCGAQK